MSHKRRTVFGRSRRHTMRGTAASRSRNRLGNIEKLEDRVLLAADINPWHNYAFPLDINGDYRATPLDALVAINALKDGPVTLGGAPVGGAESEGGQSGDTDFAPQHKFDVNNDRVLSALDVLNIVNALNGEGEELVKLVKAEGRVTQNIPANGVTPVTRPIATTVNPGETVLLNAYVEDIRTDDGVADPSSDEFGIFAAYFSVAWDAKAFEVPEGFGNHPLTIPNWPVSFVNPEHRQVFSVPGLPNKTTFEYNFNQGLAAQIDRDAGLISEAGSFAFPYHLGRQMPQVPQDKRDVFLNLHVFDVPFTAQSLYAENDQYLVEAGSSVQFSVNELFGNDGLIVGDYEFTLGGVDGVGREVLTFGDNGTATGQTGQGSVVPEANILFVNPTVNVPLAGRQLTFVGNTQPSKGQLISNPNGTFDYTPFTSVAGPTTDTFTYTVSDNQGVTRTATVTITIQPINAPPVISSPLNVTMDERKDADPAFAFTGDNGVSIADADGDPMRVTLATNAPIAVAAGSGVTFTDADGSDGTLAFSGTQAQINNALAGLTYTPAAHFYGAPTLRITAQDLDNGTALSTVQRTLTITVQPVNDPPTVVVPGNQTVVNEDLPLVISGIEVGDELDARHAPGGDVTGQLTLATTGGTLTVQDVDGLTIEPDIDGPTVVITGLTAAINQLLDLGVGFTGPIGTHTITATMSDLGNVGSGPVVPAVDTFQVTVVPPTRPFAVNDTFPVLEDSANNVLQVLLNDFNFANQDGGANLEITAVSTPANGNVVITGNATTVSYTPTPNFFGTDSFTYTIVDTTDPDDTLSTATVTVNVALVNDQPSFAVDGESMEVNEDAGPQTVANWATFDAGSPLENQVQSVEEYRVEVLTNAQLFSQSPSVDNNGTLSFTPADHAFGTSTFRVQVQDDGGIVNGGIDTSDWQEFILTIHPVNDPPTFNASDPPVINEDSGPQVVENWATDFVPGPSNESEQTLLGYEVIAVGNPALFAAEPAVDLNGTLTYTPADDAFGKSTFTVIARDSGGRDRGGDDTSAPQVFEIDVLPVNDPPSFEVAQTSITVREDAGPQTIEGWVTEFTLGPSNESDQEVLQYLVSDISDPDLFVILPSVSNDGILTFQSAQHAWGSSTFTVVLQDNGGTERGGIDQSQPQEIAITVTAVNDAPVNLLDGSDDFTRMLSTRDDVDLPLNGRLTVTDDDDDGGATYTVDLSVSHGELLVGPGDTPAASKQLSGTLAAVNQALTTLIFRPETGVYVAELTIASNDGGTSGEGPAGGLTTTDVLSISVARINQVPIAENDQIATAEGTAITFNVFQNNGNGPDSAGPNEDQFQQIGVIAVDTTGTLGTVQLLNAQTGEFRYTPPDNDFNGETTFTYTIQDNGQSFIDGQMVDDFKNDVATVTVTVWEVNDPPVAEDDLTLIDPQPAVGQQFRFHVSELLNNDRPGPANENSQNLTIISVATSAKGASVVLDGEEVVYTVPANFDHVDTFEYTVEDDGTTRGVPAPKTDTATVTVRDVVLSSVAGYVYIDTEEDGQKNGIDPGIAGVTIRLTGVDITGTQFVRETVTDGNGRYAFSEVMPGQEGSTYAISQPFQPHGMVDGQASAGNGDTTVVNANQIRVQVPLIGFGSDPSNSSSDNNNFGELGLSSDFAAVNPYRNLLYSDLIGDDPLLQSGWVFSTDMSGNLQWFVNVGGWEYYVPGQSVGDNPHHYRVQIVNGAFWVTDLHDGVERQMTVDLSSGRLRQVTSNGHTITHIVGGADYFGLTCYDPPENNGAGGGNDWGGGLFAGEGESGTYAQAVDALFAAFA